MKSLHTIRIAVENVILRHELEILTEKAQKQGLPAAVTLSLANALLMKHVQTCQAIRDRYQEEQARAGLESSVQLVSIDGSGDELEALGRGRSTVKVSLNEPTVRAS